MGSATSRPKSLKQERFRRTSSQTSSPSLRDSRSDSLVGSLPSSAPSSRVPSIDQTEAQSILITEKLQEKLTTTEVMTPHELGLVHTTWQMVISDASNICLNFFLLLKKGKPQSKKNKSGGATPLSQSPTNSAKNLLAGTKHSDLIHFALRLSCCIDRLIYHLRVQSTNTVASRRNSVSEFSLEESGELQDFLGLDNLLRSDMDRMVKIFIDTLRLVMVHSGQTKNVWSEEIHKAWTKLLLNLIQVLKDSC